MARQHKQEIIVVITSLVSHDYIVEMVHQALAEKGSEQISEKIRPKQDHQTSSNI